MHAPKFTPDELPASKPRGGKWIFRGVIVALLGVVLLPFVSLTFYGRGVQAERSCLKELDAGPWFVVEDNDPWDQRGKSLLAALLGESWELPRVKLIALQRPLDPRVKADLELLTRITHVEAMDLAGGPVTDRELRAIGPKRSLKELILTATDISDDAMAIIADLPNIEELDLSATEVTDQGLAPIANMKTLTSLVLRDSKVTAAAVQRLRAQRPDLKIAHTTVKDSRHSAVVREIRKRGGVVASHVIDGVTSLNFDGNSIANDWTSFDWSRLNDIPGITAIHISAFDQAEQVLSSLNQPAELRVLWLDECRMSQELMERIAQCDTLEHLVLGPGCALKPTHFPLIKGLTDLRTLRICDTRIGPSELRVIASLAKLTKVSLEYCEFEQGVFGSIELPSQWVTLDASSGNLTDADVEDIVRCKSLKDVDLFLNPTITDASIDKLLTLPLLERASVGMSVTPEGLARLDEALRRRAPDARRAPRD